MVRNGWLAIHPARAGWDLNIPTNSGVEFSERAFSAGWYGWEARDNCGHITVSVGKLNDRFPRASSPFMGHPNAVACFAEFLALQNVDML